MSSTYNSRPLAAEVLVNNSDWAVVRKRQDIEALIQGDLVPLWLRGAPGGNEPVPS
jgi:diaminopimelate decarboxylase